jgi:N-acetylglucosaminylphosphatidylinositol deacetylase
VSDIGNVALVLFVAVIDELSSDFQDSMTAEWDADRISGLLASAFAPQLSKATAKSSGSSKPSAMIDVLITFDAHGVSSHPNHKSLYHGARRFIWALVQGKSGWEPPVDLYTLRTVPLWRKFTGIFDCVMTLGTWAMMTDMRDKRHIKSLVFLNSLNGSGVGSAWKAMVTAHKSQMLWFRWGWILLSRYMYMNDLGLEKVTSPS